MSRPMNQKERRWQTVEAPNGARLVLPRGQDPVQWLLKFIYAEAATGVTVVLTPMVRVMRKSGHTIEWGTR